jgi:hypothetical protein
VRLITTNLRGQFGWSGALDHITVTVWLRTVTGMFLSGKKPSSTKFKLSFKDVIRSILCFGLAIFLISALLGIL